MLNQKIFVLCENENLYTNFIEKINKHFNKYDFYFDKKDFFDDVNNFFHNKLEYENNLLILFIQQSLLSDVAEYIADSKYTDYILISFHNKENTNSFLYKNLFEKINTDNFDEAFFFYKLENEISNKNKLSFLQFEVNQFKKIGASLSSEKNTLKLLNMIIDSSMKLTSSDAGTIYLVIDKYTNKLSSINSNSYEEKLLKFAIAKNDSININFEASTSVLTKESIFGYSVITGNSIKIDNAYSINQNLSYKHNPKYDLSSGYITKSILSIPMKDHENNVIGVIQLINKKKNKNEIIDYSNSSSLKNIISYDLSDEVIMNSLASQAAIALSNNILYNDMKYLLEDYKKQNKQLSFLSKKLLRAHEDERRRIAREIHDGAAQNSSNSSIRLEICKKLFKNGNYEVLENELDILGSSIKDTLKEIRTVIYDLKPSYLEGGLLSAVKNHIEVFKETTKIKVDFISCGNDDLIEYYLTSTIYRIIQESLSNIKKHAYANNVSIDINIINNNISIIISDDGKGFDTSKLNTNSKTLSGGFGLEGIVERVKIVKGNIDINSSIGKGTDIIINIPLN